MFPSSAVLLSNLESRIKLALSHSLHALAAINQKVVTRTPSRISRQFPMIKLQIAHSPSHIYDIEALLDSGATATYISSAFVEDHQIPTRKLPYPIYAYNADDSINATAITKQAKFLCHFKGHVSAEWFMVTDIGSKTMILGMTWLRTHNPEIDWRSGQMTFERCPLQCLGHRSVKDALRLLVDQASQVTEDSYSEIGQLRHNLQSKEHAATKWAIEDFKKKDVLTIEDIRKGPFSDFADVFEERTYQELPPHRKWDHKIDLTPEWESRVWRPHTYPLSYQEQKELDAFIEENLANGRIRRSESPLASPVFFISKKDGKKRMVIDYRKLNELTVKNVYPLPRIDELIQKWKGCVRFSALDIRSGYHNVRMREGDEWKTAFITNRGLFESLVMTFGLTNAPATFQTMIDSIFLIQIRRGDTNCFIDDIGIGTTPDPSKKLSDDDYHTLVLREIFALCREQKLTLKPEKCLLLQDHIPYLGHIISGTGIRPDPVKLAGIKEWPIPNNLSQLRAYLGIMSYYRRYIKDFSTIARPLNDLLKKDAVWQWQDPQQQAYQKLKDTLLDDVFLLHPSQEKQYILETDASLFAWGAVLSQEDDEGKWRPVGCMSKGFADAETRYDTHDRELLAIIRALQAFRHWLMGTKHPVTILTDHNNLRYFTTKQFLTPRQTRWMQFMTNFDIQLRYRPGRQSSVPDALSRRADHAPTSETQPDGQVLLPPSMFPPQQSVNSILTESLAQRNYGVEIYKAQAQDPLILEFNKKLESDPLPHGWKKSEELWTYMGKIYIPPILRQSVFREMHSQGPSAHPGVKGTAAVLTTDYYWPGLRSDVQEWIKNCDTCQRMKNRNKKPHGTLKPIDPVPRFWGVVTTDLITGLPMCKGFDSIFTATDKRGKIKHIAPTTSTLDSAGFAKLFLDNVWKHHGTSDKIISDRGPQMSSRSFRDTCKKLGVELALSTAYHPQTDGQSERTNQEVEQALRTVISFHQDDWVDWLPVIEFALNNRYHSGLKTTPFYANYGYHPHIGSLPRIHSPIESVEDFVDHLHQVQKNTEKSLEQAAEDMKRFYDKGRNPTPEFDIGQKVLLNNANLALNRPSRKLSERYSGPFEVLEKIGNPAHAYRLKLPDYWKNVHPVWNVSQLHPYHEDPKHPNYIQPPPEIIEGEPEWEVEAILDSKFAYGKLQFFVKWKGWPDSENSWQDELDLENAPEIIAEFYKKFPGAPRRLEDGTKTGKAVTKRRRGRKRIACMDFQPLQTFTDVAVWPIGRMTRDVSN